MGDVTLCHGEVYVRGADRPLVMAALESVMNRIGYEPWAAARIPPGYPAHGGEIRRWLVAGPDGAETLTLVSDDWASVPSRVQDLSKAMPAARLVAIVRPPLEPVRAKAWSGGALVAKFGDDPDDELFYHPIPATGAAAAAFLEAWGPAAGATLPAGDGPARPADVIAALGVARADLPYARARAEWPAPVQERWFIQRRSRLFQEG
jgi:hypothetical protein